MVSGGSLPLDSGKKRKCLVLTTTYLFLDRSWKNSKLWFGKSLPTITFIEIKTDQNFLRGTILI